jgi:hypothetical protein
MPPQRQQQLHLHLSPASNAKILFGFRSVEVWGKQIYLRAIPSDFLAQRKRRLGLQNKQQINKQTKTSKKYVNKNRSVGNNTQKKKIYIRTQSYRKTGSIKAGR